MRSLIEGLGLLLAIVRPLVLVTTVAVALGAAASWATATRRLTPFRGLGRFARQRVDPLFKPAERRLLLLGGQPAHAPWWTVAAVAIAGLLLISALQFLITQLLMADVAARSGARGLMRLGVIWTFAVVKLAIIARVVSSWLGGSRYVRWWRWAFAITDPFMEPLRRVLPALGPIDVSPIVAYFGVVLLQALVLGAL
jgi:YggT family protein